MKIELYHIDAFTNKLFSGNPAAVCPLEKWLPDSVLQKIAAENNLSETAFFVKENGHYFIRWFTPLCEVDLCGHATLAASYVIFNFLEKSSDNIVFRTREKGTLNISKKDDFITLDFPSASPAPCPSPAGLDGALGASPVEVLFSDYYLCVFESEEEIAALAPDMGLLSKIRPGEVIVTAPGKDCDFVSRFFGPGVGIDEDPVTGSAHCVLVPYWKDKLGKTRFHARQLSKRGGELFCEDAGERIFISGKAVFYMRGEIEMSID